MGERVEIYDTCALIDSRRKGSELSASKKKQRKRIFSDEF